MDKETWCQKHFADELPDCLPLPDRRGGDEEQWQKVTVDCEADVADKEVCVSSVLYLLGVYGGLTEAGVLLYGEQGWLPLRQSWAQDDAPQALAESVRQMLAESVAFAWSRTEAWEALGQEMGRGIALTLAGEVPVDDREGLALIFHVTANALELDYRTAKYTEAFSKTLALSWREILLSLSKSRTLAEVVITPAETLARLDRFNQTRYDYDRKNTLVAQFRTMARNLPDNTAVIYEKRSYTYAQVDELSDKLAYYIQQQGLGRGDTVAVFINFIHIPISIIEFLNKKVPDVFSLSIIQVIQTFRFRPKG